MPETYHKLDPSKSLGSQILDNAYNDSNNRANGNLWVKTDNGLEQFGGVVEFPTALTPLQEKCEDIGYSLMGIPKEPYTFSATIEDAHIDNDFLSEVFEKLCAKYTYQIYKRLTELRLRKLSKKNNSRRLFIKK